MAQGEERGGVGQHSAPPGWVALVSNDQVLLVGGDGFEKDRRLIVFIWGREVVLEVCKCKILLKIDPEIKGHHVVLTTMRDSPGVI